MNQFHTPVMLSEVIKHLKPNSGSKYIDCTLGGGGHTAALLKSGAEVLALDCDQEAIDHVIATLGQPVNLHLVKTNFTHLSEIAQDHGFIPSDGILFDLGVSSHQLTSAHRGMSLKQDAPLDMRLDQELTVTAKDLLAALGRNELKHLFEQFGNEPKAKIIAQKIVDTRRQIPITTTSQLARLVESLYPRTHLKIHPATKAFQALRIAINDELNNIRAVLPQAIDILRPGGTIVVISFHQGEDQIIKNLFKTQSQQGTLSLLTPKPLTPTAQEIARNPRSRSAKLRAAVKL